MNFAINLDGDMASKANADADALQKLNDALRAEQKALSGMEAQMRALQKASVVDISLHRQLSAAIQAQKDSIAGLTAQQVSHGRAAFEASDAMGEETGKSAALASMIGNVLATAFVKLASAVGRAVSSIYEFAEARADTERMLETVFRSQEAAEHTYDVIADISKRIAISQSRANQVADNLAAAGMVNGDRMVASIEAVGKAEAARKGAGQVIEGIITRSQRSRWFSVSRDELLKSGLTFRDLAKTISSKTGQGMQEAVAALRVGRVDLKTGLDALNQTIEDRLGKIAAKKFLTIGYQATRLKATFGNLFAKVDTSRLAAVMDRISTWLDTSSVGGAALQEIFNAAIDTLGDAIEAVWPYAQTFMEFLLLSALKIYNAFYPLRKAIKELFDGAGVSSFEDMMLGLSDTIGTVAGLIADNYVPIMITAFLLLAPSIWSAAVAMGAFAASTLMAAAPFAVLGALVWAAYELWSYVFEEFSKTDWGYIGDQIVEAFTAVVEWFRALPARMAQFAVDIVTGLVDGITSGAARFVDAMKSMGQKGLAAFKNFFGFSTSAPTGDVPGFASGGYTGDGNPDDVAGVVHKGEYVLDAETTKKIRGGSNSVQSTVSTDNSQTRGNTVVFSEGSIVITLGGGGSGQALEQIRAEMPQIMADIFEQMGFSMGAERAA